MIVSLQNVPKNLENLRKYENLQMQISTKPCYKLFSVVHNYFVWMFPINERIYDDRISKMSPKTDKICENMKTWNCICAKKGEKKTEIAHIY